MSKDADHIHTRIWSEEPEPDNPFATRAAYLRGYDVYGEMLGTARWVQMLHLLFREQPPSPAESRLLEMLAVALANPGPRDASVHAAMCGGVGGSTAAASLMAALAVGAGCHGGAREVLTAMQNWVDCGQDIDAWRHCLTTPPTVDDADIWPAADHPAGFDPYAVSASQVVHQMLTQLARVSSGPRLPWLALNRAALEQAAGAALAVTGVAAAALCDLGFTAEQGEMLYLLLRLPGAAAHALEQRGHSYKRFPFFSLEVENDPGPQIASAENKR